LSLANSILCNNIPYMHQIQNLMFMKFSTFKYCSIVCRGNLVSHSQRCATFEPSRNIRAAANTQICDEIRGLMPATTINNVFERIDVSPSIAALLCNSGTACLRSRDKTKYIQSHLYSPLIPRKLLKTSSVRHTPARYPQYTSDHTIGKWEWFSVDLWTTGFFPPMLYEINARQQLCHGLGAGDADVDWLGLGRSWRTAEIPLDVKSHVGHDVTYPFVQELLLCVPSKSRYGSTRRLSAL